MDFELIGGVIGLSFMVYVLIASIILAVFDVNITEVLIKFTKAAFEYDLFSVFKKLS